MHLAFLETSRKGSIYLILILIYGTTCLYWNLHCGKTARHIWKIFRQQIENNIAFHLVPRSHLAVAVCASDVAGNIEKKYHIRDSDFEVWDNLSTLKLALRKNGSLYSRCFQRRQMHKLPRLNGCGVSSERQYCLLSADEIFLKFNEPFSGNISLTKLLSYGDVLAWLRKDTS